MNPEIIYIRGAGLNRKDMMLVHSIKMDLDEDFVIHTPEMPDPSCPDCQDWIDCLDAVFHKIDGSIILIGHSLGASVILKYLSERIIENPVESIHLLAAPFWGAKNWPSSEFSLAEACLSILRRFRRLYFYHCEDDEVVSSDHLLNYKKGLPHAHTHLFASGGHYFSEISNLLSDQIKPSQTQLLPN